MFFFLFLHYLCCMKTLCIILGSISLALGILGIFLPLLPTTPFLLLTAALYFKGSPRLYNWLLNHRHFGPYIRNFRENKSNSAPSQSYLTCADVGNNAILHLLPHSSAMGKNSLGVDCRRGHLSYSLFQDIKIVGKSLTGICQFIFPMFYGVLPNNIGYIFYGDKRNFLWHGRQMPVHRLPYLLRLR